jgi:WD40 repeat protein/predicted Ser/Thr protein kinase
MELDDTEHAGEPERERSLLDSQRETGELVDKLAALADRDDGGVEQRQRRAMVAAALFDEPILSAKIGRFTIVRKLGAGGMGVVYVAYDEQLDRRVAVKLLRNTVASSEAQVRLEREAQAMARLSHPNVVTVHEVGRHDGQVFMAMEFVDGEDLRQWLTRSKRDWREVVAVFLQAGEGLAAAHEAGIVHRDFKPDNVLVGNDGRVRVADFGLANSVNTVAGPVDPSLSDSQRRLGVALTRPGAVMGTPAYMPPEQFRGAATDAQADQFSFCVALWEGLYGARPFKGKTLLELSMAVAAGEVIEPPQDSAVPTWLRAVMLRALAAEPSARWGSMREMLDVLARDPEARRRRIALVLGFSLAGLALVGGLIGFAAGELRRNARQRYWNILTEQLLDIERERGLAQANADARQARDATRMNVVRSYRPKHEVVEHHDPTVAAALLREVEGETRNASEWISMANELLGQPLARAVLQGHRDAIVPVVFAPDGATLYTGSEDGEVRRWAVPGGEGELIGTHGKAVSELAVSSDGRLLASSAYDGSIRLWSPDSGESRELEGHPLAVMSVTFSPDGRRLASASKDGTVRVHELDSGRTSVLEADGGEVYAVDFDAAGTRVLTGSKDGRARIWSLVDSPNDRGPLHVLQAHENAIFFARMLDDGRVLTASDDRTARVWQLDGEPSSTIVARHGREISALDVHGSQLATASLDGTINIGSLDFPHTSFSLPAHDDGVWSLAFTPDGAWLASGSFDHTARLTRSDGRGVAKVFVGHSLSLYDVALDPSGRWLATGSYDSTVRLWDLQQPLLATRLVGHDKTVQRVRAHAASERVLTASQDGTVRIWSTRDGTTLAQFPGKSMLFDATFSNDGERIATGAGSGEVLVWSSTGELQHRLVGHELPVWQVRFDNDGARVASASLDGTARIWSTETGALLATLRGHEDAVYRVDFDPDGAQLVTGSRDGTVRVWDTASGEVEHILRSHTGKVSVLVRSPDGRMLATGSDDGSARLWSTDWSSEPLVLAGHGKEIQAIVFDASGQRLLTTCSDHRARIWDTRNGELLHVLEGHSNAIWDGAFLPDDRVVTASADGTLRIWSLQAAAPPLVLSGHGSEEVLSVAVINGGRGLVSGSTDGTARLWQLELLTSDPNQLQARLEAATSLCPSVEQRIHELGHDDEQAALGYAACERSQGR